MRDIELAIQEHKQKVLELYPEHQILGIFLYGSQNYNIATENSDVDTKAIIVPNLYNLAIKPVKTHTIELENGEHCEVMDIMHLVANFRKQNINFVEILFTDYCWVNPLYKWHWEFLFKNMREDIAIYNPAYCLKSICGQAIHTLKQDKTDAKKYANGLRLRNFLIKYFDEKVLSYKKCIYVNPKFADYLIHLKTDKPLIDVKQTNELIEWFENVKELIVKNDIEKREELDDVLNKGIITLIKVCEGYSWSN